MSSMRSFLVLFYLLVISKFFFLSGGRPTGMFMHLTDIHLDRRYQEGTNPKCNSITVCCHNDSSPGPEKCGPFGDYECDAPFLLVNETFKFASTLNPDFIFWTGDDPAHDIFSQDRAYNLENIEILTQMFLKYFPNTVVFPCLGNHDTFPVDQLDRPPNSKWLLDVVGKYWSKWLPPDALKTFKYGGYYQVQLGPKLRLIALNTLYYDAFNFWVLWNTTGPDPAGQWQWFVSALEDAQRNNQTVWIMGHIYPGHYQAITRFSHHYALISSQYRNIIKAHFFGHSHQDEIRVLRDASNVPYGIMYIAPSVTPFQRQNPSVRIYHYYKDTYEIFDIDQYVADLDKANTNGKLEYRLEYTARKAYGLASLSPQAWMNVVNTFQTNDTLWQQYYRFWRGEYPHLKPCTGPCKKTMICEILSIEPQQFFECNSNQLSTTKQTTDQLPQTHTRRSLQNQKG